MKSGLRVAIETRVAQEDRIDEWRNVNLACVKWSKVRVELGSDEVQSGRIQGLRASHQ